MKSTSIAALAALLSTGALAVPTYGHHAAHAHLHQRRDVVWVTEYDVEVVTVVETVTAGVPPASTSTTSFEVPSPVTTTSYDPPSTTTTTTPAATTTSSTTTTSAYVAPPPPSITTTTTTTTTSTSVYFAPSPSTTQAAAPSQALTDTSSSGNNAGGPPAGTSSTGDFTMWEPALGSCGMTNSTSEPVVAISHIIYDQYTVGGNPNNNPVCGRMVTLKNTDGSGTTRAMVVDRCVGCAAGDLDLSDSLFSTVTGQTDTRIPGSTWTWD